MNTGNSFNPFVEILNSKYDVRNKEIFPIDTMSVIKNWNDVFRNETSSVCNQ